MAVWNGTYCYFIVAGATEATNKIIRQKDRWSVQFDIWKARDICNGEGATLPIHVDAKEEMSFIIDAFKPIHFDPDKKLQAPVAYVALGLKQKGVRIKKN